MDAHRLFFPTTGSFEARFIDWLFVVTLAMIFKMSITPWNLYPLRPWQRPAFPSLANDRETEAVIEGQIERARAWGYAALLVDLRDSKLRPRWMTPRDNLHWVSLLKKAPERPEPFIQWTSWREMQGPAPEGCLERIFPWTGPLPADFPQASTDLHVAVDEEIPTSLVRALKRPLLAPRFFDPWVRTPQALGLEPLEVRLDRRESKAPKWSILIPCFRHQEELRNTLAAIARLKGPSFEVIVVEDWEKGSATLNPEEGARLPILFLRLIRATKREWGDRGFRAGSARNLAARYARGERLLFLDADILLRTDALERFERAFDANALMQAKRWNLASPSLFAKDPDGLSTVWDCFLSDRAAWEEFQSLPDWKGEHPWSWVSTFCLAVDAERFRRSGGFKESFDQYGLEDTEFGYRWRRENGTFRKMDVDVFHQLRVLDRTEYDGNPGQRQELLAGSMSRFLRWSLDPGVLDWIESQEVIPWAINLKL